MLTAVFLQSSGDTSALDGLPSQARTVHVSVVAQVEAAGLTAQEVPQVELSPNERELCDRCASSISNMRRTCSVEACQATLCPQCCQDLRTAQVCQCVQS